MLYSHVIPGIVIPHIVWRNIINCMFLTQPLWEGEFREHRVGDRSTARGKLEIVTVDNHTKTRGRLKLESQLPFCSTPNWFSSWKKKSALKYVSSIGQTCHAFLMHWLCFGIVEKMLGCKLVAAEVNFHGHTKTFSMKFTEGNTIGHSLDFTLSQGRKSRIWLINCINTKAHIVCQHQKMKIYIKFRVHMLTNAPVNSD